MTIRELITYDMTITVIFAYLYVFIGWAISTTMMWISSPKGEKMMAIALAICISFMVYELCYRYVLGIDWYTSLAIATAVYFFYAVGISRYHEKMEYTYKGI